MVPSAPMDLVEFDINRQLTRSHKTAYTELQLYFLGSPMDRRSTSMVGQKGSIAGFNNEGSEAHQNNICIDTASRMLNPVIKQAKTTNIDGLLPYRWP